MTVEWIGLLALTVMDMLTVSVIFICAFNKRMLLMPVWYRAGLIAAALGFAAQSASGLYYLSNGTVMDTHQLFFRGLKDIGITLVATHYFWQIIRGRKKLK
ncbi:MULTISPECIES: hypothetical protein [Rahnella]|jgi:hypothetical protein|uniref:hypothetical protein n=1 Tax=Rahnella TaxID=34037 RepID=UPI000690E162|nr:MULTISPECIES: hypothetical protein [Rahnella]QQN33790.1 hypothetical protein JHW33_15275 [Rahnella aceris]